MQARGLRTPWDLGFPEWEPSPESYLSSFPRQTGQRRECMVSPLHRVPGTHALTCSAGSRGPGGPSPKLGGGMGWGCAVLLPTLPSLSLGNGSPGRQSAPQPRPSLWGLEQLLYSKGAPRTCLPQLKQATQQGSFVLRTFWLGGPGVGSHREAPSLRALFGTPCSPLPT